jgi:hypothetical protein
MTATLNERSTARTPLIHRPHIIQHISSLLQFSHLSTLNMKSTTILFAALSVLSSSVVDARKCTAGLKYCGYNLLKIGMSSLSTMLFLPLPTPLLTPKGDYRAEIIQELYNHNINTNEDHVQNSVFGCSDSGNGWIGWKDHCSTGCRDGGSGKNDHC